MTRQETQALTPAEKYEQFFVPAMFGPFARDLVGRAGVRSGQSVLDLACGTGIVARTAAPVVGAAGRVVALDLRPGMLAAARALPAPAGATIEWVEADATDPGLPDAGFDHVICQAGLQFFPDRARALREARRMLKEGGRLTVLVWQGIDRHPVFEAIAESELRHLGGFGVTEEEAIMPFVLGDREALRLLIEEAGFRDVETAEESREASFPDPDNFVRNSEYAYAAVIPEFAADPAAFRRFLDTIEQETREVVEKHRRGDRIVFPMHANIATARR